MLAGVADLWPVPAPPGAVGHTPAVPGGERESGLAPPRGAPCTRPGAKANEQGTCFATMGITAVDCACPARRLPHAAQDGGQNTRPGLQHAVPGSRASPGSGPVCGVSGWAQARCRPTKWPELGACLPEAQFL